MRARVKGGACQKVGLHFALTTTHPCLAIRLDRISIALSEIACHQHVGAAF